MSLWSKERLQRAVELPRRYSSGVKTAIFFAILAVVALLAAMYDRTPKLSHVRLKFVSGTEKGNYFAIVKRLGEEAQRRHGRIANVPTAGSVETIERLVAGRSQC